MSKKLKKCANPLFEKWIEEWRDDAAARNLKTKFVYNQALKSLRRYPLPLKSGKEAKILEYFGDKICSMLDKKLETHRQQTGELEEDSGDDLEEILSAGDTRAHKKAGNGAAAATSPKKNNIYIPRRRSGAYAILLTLCRNKLRNDGQEFMKKAELLSEAQPLCDASFTIPDPGSYYTAWSTMGQLIKKGLVMKEGHPPRFSLTVEGAVIADKILKSESGVNAIAENSSHTSSSQASTQSIASSVASNSQRVLFEDFTLRPGQFDIVLCVDNAETLGGAGSDRKMAVQTGLRKNGVNFDIRKLHVGDFVWVAREKVQPVPGSLELPPAKELVLDYIIERKRKDDLASSIIDGRFKEQKMRLKSCGLSRCIYLVEEYGKKDNFALPAASLQQAVINTQIIDGFTIKNTKDSNESIAYLTQMTRQLIKCYATKTLTSCSFGKESTCSFESKNMQLLTFEEFNRNAVKNKPLSVEETFGRQLLKLFGLSADKVKAILSLYPTPATLNNAFVDSSNEREGSNLISNIKYGKSERNIGPVLGQLLYQFYTRETFA